MTVRDRERTEQKILEAVGRRLAKAGFEGVGINSIAREAKVDKALIYRYFGSLDDLLKAFAESQHHWPDLGQIAQRALADTRDPAEFTKRVLKDFMREVRDDRVLQEILRWELSEQNELSDCLARQRERGSLAMMRSAMEALPPMKDTPDMPAISAILVTGMTFLLLRSKTYPEYNGIPTRTAEGWQRIEAAVDRIVDALFVGPARQ